MHVISLLIIIDFYFRFPEVDKLNGTILRLDEVDFYYSKDKYIFKNVDISACLTSRICIVGENGAGKFNFIYCFLFFVYSINLLQVKQHY
jgi:ATPase subunit of ABC transporter with duplicated ATPase domains